MKIGITGHQKLDNTELWNWVKKDLSATINRLNKSSIEFTGISSLAIGADQIFAKIVLDMGGKLYIVIPFSEYEKKFEKDDLDNYKELLKKSEKVETLQAKSTEEESYFVAGKRVVELSDIMIAIWNGKKAAGLGGTGDAVKYAKSLEKKIYHINPYTKETKII